MEVERKHLNDTWGSKKHEVVLNDDVWTYIKSFLFPSDFEGFVNAIVKDKNNMIPTNSNSAIFCYCNSLEFYLKNVKTIENNSYLLIDRSKSNGFYNHWSFERKVLEGVIEILDEPIITRHEVKFRRSKINLYYDNLRGFYYFHYYGNKVLINLKSCPIF